MAVRIQVRRDTAANWVANNPSLREGEMGIEIDTLKIKIGPTPVTGDATPWNSITAYANLVPSDFNSVIDGYVETTDIGAQGGVVGLNSSYNAIIPGSSIIIEGPTADSYETTLTVTDPTADRTITLPNATGTMALTTDITTAIDAITTDVIEEGSTNKYFSDERAQDAVATALAAGTHTNLTVTYNDVANSISLAAAPGYVDEQAVDAVAAALAAGTHTNISVSYNDAGNAISLTGAQTYSDENAQDAIGNSLGGGLSYNDTTGAISVDTTTIQARVANVTDTEIGYLDGVTSAIQTQLNAKAASADIAELAQDAVGTILSSDLAYNDSTPGIGLNYVTVGNTLLNGVSGSSYGLIGTSTYLDVKDTNGYNKEIELDIAAVETKLETDGFAKLASPTFTGTVAAADLTLSGNLTVNGTTTNLNSTNLVIEDKNIVLGDTTTPTDITADGGGITLKGTTDKTLNWVDATDAWTSSEDLNLLTGKVYEINGTTVLSSTQVLGKSLPSGTVVGTSDTQTLTNKTLTSPVISTITNTGTITLPTTTGTLALTSQVPATSTTAITANTATTIDTIALTDFITAEYQVTIHQGTSTRSSKILVQTDGTSVDYNEYAIMATGTAIPGVSVAASVSSTNMILQATITNGATANGRAFIIKSVTSGVAPAAPTIGAATYGDAQATVTFTPQDNGGSAVTSYTVTSNPGGITASGSASPVTITGLTNLTSYTFTVTATNKYGTSSASSASNSVAPTVVPVVTGGTLSSDSTYYYRTFTSTSSLGVSAGNLSADILTIAGGGSGGYGTQASGGGGAGGVYYASSQTVVPNTYTCTVGAGGGSGTSTMGNGSNSQFGALTAAVGGGQGGYHGSVNAGAAGGSGGGGVSLGGTRSLGGAGTAGQGFAGAAGVNGGYSGGGGGGAGAAATDRFGGAGTSSYSSWLAAIAPQMSGVTNWTTATSSTTIASGGSGMNSGGTASTLGGGGTGGWSNQSGGYPSGTTDVQRSGGQGTSNTGGGGGGAWQYTGTSTVGLGGSGIIIVRYTKASVGG